MKSSLVLMKLGGSLITEKQRPNTFRPEYIGRIAKELAALRVDSDASDYIIGTGAGSFGHFPAHKFGLREGARGSRQVLGMGITHNAVQRLSLMAAESLTAAQLPAFVVSPSGLFVSNGKEVADMHLEPLRLLLEWGAIPIVHGDTVVDSVRGTTIFSTEKVLQVCLDYLRPFYPKVTVIYVMDADGLLDTNSVLIEELGLDDDIHVHDSLEHDVSGGIVSKVASARQAAKQADFVYLVSGRRPGAIAGVLAGKYVGTRVLG